MVRSFEPDAVNTRDAWERRLTDMPVLAMLYLSTAPVDLGDPLEPAQQRDGRVHRYKGHAVRKNGSPVGRVAYSDRGGGLAAYSVSAPTGPC